MINYDAETWVIIYPYGAGGRFLELLLSLDPKMWGIDNQPRKDNLDVLYQDFLRTKRNAHFFDSDLLQDMVAGQEIGYSERYVFNMHHHLFRSNYFTKFTNLKPVFITVHGEQNWNMLQERRKKLPTLEKTNWNNVPWVFSESEMVLLDLSPEISKVFFHTEPVAVIELDDYWSGDPERTGLGKLFAENNLDIKNWKYLYQLWHYRAVQRLLTEM